jgi:hypothetical protein
MCLILLATYDIAYCKLRYRFPYMVPTICAYRVFVSWYLKLKSYYSTH